MPSHALQGLSSFLDVQILAIVACLAWMAVSSGLILVNKYIMSTDKFHFPMALSGLGMAFSSVASFLVCRVRVKVYFSTHTFKEGVIHFRKLTTASYCSAYLNFHHQVFQGLKFLTFPL